MFIKCLDRPNKQINEESLFSSPTTLSNKRLSNYFYFIIEMLGIRNKEKRRGYNGEGTLTHICLNFTSTLRSNIWQREKKQIMVVIIQSAAHKINSVPWVADEVMTQTYSFNSTSNFTDPSGHPICLNYLFFWKTWCSLCGWGSRQTKCKMNKQILEFISSGIYLNSIH